MRSNCTFPRLFLIAISSVLISNFIGGLAFGVEVCPAGLWPKPHDCPRQRVIKSTIFCARVHPLLADSNYGLAECDCILEARRPAVIPKCPPPCLLGGFASNCKFGIFSPKTTVIPVNSGGFAATQMECENLAANITWCANYCNRKRPGARIYYCCE